MKRFAWLILVLPFVAFGQPGHQPDAAEIKLKLKKLNFLGSVLYMAAHPDDENTRVITYLANERLAETAYLSLTRGDGGQNLIGAEIGNELGVIRTQELLAARRIDGGRQFFTRAIDFGFSKSADEAFQVWGKQAVLADAIKVWRKFQPDVVITRFPPDERAGHGHHTASAVLAGEAFDLAGKPDVFPEQVEQYGTWQPKRLYTNTGRWWNQSINESTPGVITIDVGGYNPLLGQSYAEISALSSSQHKSQGWGRRGERGYLPEFLEHMKGKEAKKDIFEDINTSWSRVTGGEKIQPLVDRAIASFNPENPSALVPQLLEIKKAIEALPEDVWKKRKLAETIELIRDCLALYVEVTASQYYGSPGEHLQATVEVVNRGGSAVRLKRVSSSMLQWDTLYKGDLPANKAITFRSKVRVHPGANFSEPYWLTKDHSTGLFEVADAENIGKPENSPAVEYDFTLEVDAQELVVASPLIYKWVDRVKGELWRPFEIVPPVFVNPLESVMIFNSQEGKALSVLLKSSVNKPLQGRVTLQLPSGWRSEPASIDFALAKRDDEELKTFTVFPSSGESSGEVIVQAMFEGKKYDESLNVISYDHIPAQTLLPRAKVSVVRLDLRRAGDVVAYIKGAGDEIPSALRNMGYDVVELADENISAAALERFDAVVLGIRAFNTNTRLPFVMDELLNYVKEGGTLVVQYNTTMDLSKEKYTPYPLKISRERVTEEDAEVRFLKPEHQVLNWPNKISTDDFKGWVQERGLYFPNEWDAAYQAVLSMNDKGETPKNGSLLIADYGKGKYVYTGISFFRELPQGVIGAYKLFANIVSLGARKSTAAMRNQDKSR